MVKHPVLIGHKIILLDFGQNLHGMLMVAQALVGHHDSFSKQNTNYY